jgi:hypothetical protein
MTMEPMMDVEKPAGGLSALTDVLAIPPVKGLTYRKGKREANVHDVRDGIVYFGVYLDGESLPSGAYQATLDEWNRMAEQAVLHGAEVFTLVRANVRAKPPKVGLSE